MGDGVARSHQTSRKKNSHDEQVLPKWLCLRSGRVRHKEGDYAWIIQGYIQGVDSSKGGSNGEESGMDCLVVYDGRGALPLISRE